MRWMVLLIVLLLPAAGCGRTPAEPEVNGDREDAEDMDTQMYPLLGLDAGELAQMMQGDDWHLRLAAGATLAVREDIPLPERVELLLQALEHEIESPARGPISPGVGYMPAEEYARLNLARSLTELGPEAVPSLRRAAGAASAGARDFLLIALADLGDQDTAPPVRDLLAHSPNPWLRMAAANVLGVLGDRESIPLLTAALQDPFMTTAESCIQQIDLFPVRESAAAALRELGVAVERRGDGIFEIGE